MTTPDPDAIAVPPVDDASGADPAAASTQRLGRGAGSMAVGTAVSRATGMVRGSVLVAAVGLNAQAAGAFNAANWLPNTLYMLIAGGLLNAVLVPQVVRAYRTGRGQAYVDRLLTLSITLLAAATILLTAAAPLIIRVTATANADNPAYIQLATAFALWCVPQVFFYGLYTLLGQVLNARGSFGPYMWAPVINNMVSILGFGVFIAAFGSYSLSGRLSDPAAWGVGPISVLGGVATLGIVAQALVLLVPLHRSGFRYRPRWDFRGAGLSTAGRVAGWTFGALLIGQIGIVAVSRVGTAADQVLVDGHAVAGYTAYTNAFVIFMLPHSLVTVSLLTSMFTRLSGHAAAGDRRMMRMDASLGLRLIGVFTIFATAVVAVLALPIVRAIYWTALPAEAGSLAPIIVAMAGGLSALGAWSLAQRIFYAHEDAKGLFWIQVVMACIVGGGAMLSRAVLPAQWWVVGVGASIALSYVLGAAWGGVAVRRRLGGGGRNAMLVHAKAVLAAALAAAAGWPLVRMFGDPSRIGVAHALVICVVVGSVMLTVYVVVLRLLHVDELTQVAAPALAIVHRTMGRTGLGRAAKNPDGGGGQVDVVLGHGTLLAGRYRLDHPVVTDLPGVERWLAHDQILDRPVTATLLRYGRVAQAQDGARRAALVTDPRLLRVLDVGDHQGLAYVVTERAPGRTLADLTARGPLPADQARAIVGEAAVALEIARRRGVHHLALRPAAVHVSAKGVVVSGLGLDGELRDHGLGDARSTTRADTVALVALLYVALTGRRPGSPDGPWAAPTVAGTMVPPAELVPGIPNDLDTLCAVTLGPHDDGPHSPAELVRDLEPWGRVDLTGIEGASTWHTVAAVAAASPDVAAREDGEVAMAPESADGVDGLEGAGPEAPGDLGDAAQVPTSDDLPEKDAAEEPRGDDAATATDGTVPGLPDAPVGEDEEAVAPESGASMPAIVRNSVRGLLAGIRSDRPGTPPPAFVPTAHHPDPRSTSALKAGASGPRSTARVGDAPVATSSRRGSDGAGPPPAIPGRSSPRPADPGRQDRPGGPPQTSAARAAVQPTAQPHDVRTPTAHTPGGHRDFDSLIGRGAEVLTRTRFDPTPIVLGLVGLLIIIGAIFAWNSLTAPGGLFSGLGGLVDTGTTTGPRPTSFDAPSPSAGESGGTETAAPPAEAAPAIASAQMLDPPPGGDNNEHPEAVNQAIDGNPATAWFSRTYKSPTYGMKSGIGYAVTLQTPAVVTTVTLTVNGSGGMVEVRATDPATPTAGPVLAGGPLSPTTVLTLDPATTTQTIVLWFTALPQTADGSNRVELAEVTLS